MDDGENKNRSLGMSILAGIMFGAAWWIYIDGAAAGSQASNAVAEKATGYTWIPGVFSTLAFILINGFVSWTKISSRDDDVDGSACRSKVFLILGLVVAMACIAVSLLIMVEGFLNNPAAYKWTGISVFAQNLLIFISMFVMRFGTLPPADDF